MMISELCWCGFPLWIHIREFFLATVLWLKRRTLVDSLQALKTWEEFKWKSLLQLVEIFSERLQPEYPDVLSSSHGNFMSHSWSVAREVQSIPAKHGQILTEGRAEDFGSADVSGSDCEPLVDGWGTDVKRVLQLWGQWKAVAEGSLSVFSKSAGLG